MKHILWINKTKLSLEMVIFLQWRTQQLEQDCVTGTEISQVWWSSASWFFLLFSRHSLKAELKSIFWDSCPIQIWKFLNNLISKCRKMHLFVSKYGNLGLWSRICAVLIGFSVFLEYTATYLLSRSFCGLCILLECH